MLKCVGHNKTKEKNYNFAPRPTKIAPHTFLTLELARDGGSASFCDHLSHEMGPGTLE